MRRPCALECSPLAIGALPPCTHPIRPPTPIHLQVEEKALEKEKDKQSVGRLEEVRRELGEVQDRLHPLQMRYRWGWVRDARCSVCGYKVAGLGRAGVQPAASCGCGPRSSLLTSPPPGPRRALLPSPRPL